VLPVEQYQTKRGNGYHSPRDLLPVLLPKHLKVKLVRYS